MVLVRALGWVLLAMAVAAVVNDCLAWWSEGALRVLTLGELWGRLDLGSLRQVQGWTESHLGGALWRYVGQPILSLPALPVFVVGGALLIWAGARAGRGVQPHFIGGSRPRRRRHSSLS
ncbi:hypothetical protein SAMN02745126_02424 [Enhydrobacter aerosaccus]|uniref:Uncharacterized protein n=1 Tax=Enhydrobacter aerosaccus TaxID=225324 RepID=A0A1T4NSP1_9HYPH|nr:hypothetical protein [Enhydrobacter aerosaccus]SJZ82076.1 hypothetical protein SAMN02745126_02424 [Enhydrobacter aerosaccus]